jgi:hypothetical protein
MNKIIVDQVAKQNDVLIKEKDQNILISEVNPEKSKQ